MKEVMTMPVLTRSRQAIRVAGAATAAAPYVREVATDRDLREAARTSFRSLARVYDEMAADARLRDRVFDRARGVALTTAGEPWRPLKISVSPRFVRWGILAIGFMAGVSTIIAVLAYPRSRKRVSQAVVDARNGVVSLTDRVRMRTPGSLEEDQETISADENEAREAA
jgi:hypothetical protein